MTDDDLRALRGVVGEGGVRQHPPLSVEGAEVEVTLEPHDGATLAELLRALGRRGLAVLVRGGGTRLGLANPVSRVDAILSTRGLSGVEVLDAEEGVVHALAGTPLATVRKAALEAGWELPLDPPGETTTVGGAIACAALGPRALGYGRARDVVLGLGVVLGSGERTRCGGRVVKNVTGYDLQKLYAGCFGTLGVIESAWLRLRPLPERVALMSAPLGPGAATLAQALAAARGPATRAAVWLDPGLASDLAPDGGRAPGALLVVELGGGQPVVELRARELAEELGAQPASQDLLEGVRDFQEGGCEALRVRVDALASRLPTATAALLEAGARVAVHPGLGLAYASFAPERSEAALTAARAAADRAGGGWRLESAPLELRRRQDVFGESPPALGVMRTLKGAYDPTGVLNPGRFAGGL